MAETGTPVWVWILGGVIIVPLILVALLLDWIFSALLILALIGVGVYLWYRNRQKST